MGRLSISVSRENRPVIVQRKWPATPKLLLLIIIPMILIGILWYIVTTHRTKKASAIENSSNYESRFGDQTNIDEYELQFMVNHHIHHNFTKERNQKFEESFCFVQLFAPCHEILASIGSCKSQSSEQGSGYDWKVAEKIKALDPQPAFAMIDAPTKLMSWSDDYYRNVTKGFVKLLSDLDIPLILIPGQTTPIEAGAGQPITGQSIVGMISSYKETYGEDHFEFYVQGVKFIVTNSVYDYADHVLPTFDLAADIQPAVFEYESWLSLSLEESRSGDYQHVILLRNSLESFEPAQRKDNLNGSTQDELITRDAKHSMTQRFLDKIINYDVQNVITFEGREQCQGVEFESTESQSTESIQESENELSSGHKTDHHEPVGYYRGAKIILSDGLNANDYRVVWVFRDDVHDQVHDAS